MSPCLDQKRLNQNLTRCPHKIPTLEELNRAFANAKYFSKLDAKAGYWSVHLARDSQELTTFRTPFGRYCFRRLPLGLATSQDIFQQRMDDIISAFYVTRHTGYKTSRPNGTTKPSHSYKRTSGQAMTSSAKFLASWGLLTILSCLV
ncbi:hypothetical protein BSL78_29404 [Apostichopus japonicus]|uniref:Reverse transcriptase domain-containing protein n=1 Tax=Stichopus japonicus TaxID=307972 RepID=A0A2G8JDF7_STIJA|nr:hypothetical protein BSL78_29404 [Apostichopus japonicus]